MYEGLQNNNFPEKQRNQEFDQTRKALQKNIDDVNIFLNKTQRKWALLEAKLKKEMLVVRTALTKSKLLLAEMKIYIMENVINHRCQESPKTIDVNEDKSRSNAPSPSTSKTENYPGINFVSNDPKHHIVTPSSRGSISPLESSNKIRSYTSSFSPKSMKATFIKRAERDITFKDSTMSKGFTPYSRNYRKSGAQSLVAENQPRKSTSSSPNMEYLNRCGNTQGSMVENLPRNSTLRSPINISSEYRNVKESVSRKNSLNTNIHLEMNKSLTESMMSEFDKTFSKDNASVQKNGKKHEINPVENTDPYKEPSNNNLHASHTTHAVEINSPIPPVHSGDSRKYPSSDKERAGPSKSPISFPVLGIHWDNPASQPKEIDDKQRSSIPSETNMVQITPELVNENFYFRPISPKYLIQNYTENLLENATRGNASVTSSPMQTVYERDEGKNQLDNANNNLPHSSQNSDSLNITENRHISVPVPPMYEHYRGRGSYSQIEIPQAEQAVKRLNLSYRLDYATKNIENDEPASPNFFL